MLVARVVYASNVSTVDTIVACDDDDSAEAMHQSEGQGKELIDISEMPCSTII